MCGVSKAVKEERFKIADEFTDEEWLPLIKEGAEMGILEWWIGGGGEPLVRRDLTLEIVKTIKHHSPESEVELTTNGTRFTEEMLRDLVTVDLDKMQFSIDAPDAATHDWIRRKKGTFEKATWAIQTFSKLKQELGKDVPWLTVNAVLNGKNYNRLEDFIGFAKTIGLEQVNVTPLRVTDEMRPGMERDGLILDAEQKKEAFRSAERARRLGEKMGVGFGFLVNRDWEEISEKSLKEKMTKGKRVGPRDTSKRTADHPFLSLRCYEPWYTLAIDAWGNPGPCVTGAMGDARYSFRHHTLEEIWYGEYFHQIRARIADNRLIDACSQCTITDVRERVGLQLNEHLKSTGYQS